MADLSSLMPNTREGDESTTASLMSKLLEIQSSQEKLQGKNLRGIFSSTSRSPAFYYHIIARNIGSHLNWQLCSKPAILHAKKMEGPVG